MVEGVFAAADVQYTRRGDRCAILDEHESISYVSYSGSGATTSCRLLRLFHGTFVFER